MQREIYIFLDIDGVLNTSATLYNYLLKYKQRPLNMPEYTMVDLFESVLVTNLNHLCRALEELGHLPYVVLSSNWRMLHDIMVIQQWLEIHGLEPRFLPWLVTPEPIHIHGIRGSEIQRFMDQHGVIERNIIILDDRADMDHLEHRLVLTDLSDGLTKQKVEEALNLV